MRSVLLRLTQITSLVALVCSLSVHIAAWFASTAVMQGLLLLLLCLPLPIAGVFWAIWQMNYFWAARELPFLRPDWQTLIPPLWWRAWLVAGLYTSIMLILMLTTNQTTWPVQFREKLLYLAVSAIITFILFQTWQFFAFIVPNIRKPIRWYTDLK